MSNAVVTDWPSGSANTGWPQEPTGMLMPGRVQGWPAGTQRAANAAERLLSQAVAWWDVEQYRDGDRFLRNRGTGGELLDLRLGSAAVANSNDPRFLASEDSGYVYLPGVSGNYLSVPDEASLDITGDLDVRVQVGMDDWTPSANMMLASKRTGAASQISWSLLLVTTGVLRFTWSTDGSTAIFRDSTASVGITDGDVRWVRVTLDVDNGASGHDVKFWTSPDGAIWTQVGSTVTTAGTTSVFASTAQVDVGAYALGTTNPAPGRFYRAQVLNGIDGTTVLDIDCDAITSGSATSFTAVTNQTVTINRSTTGRKSVAVPSRHKGGKPVMLLGSDDFLEVQDNWQHGLLNFDAGQSFTVLTVYRMPSFTANQQVLSKGGVEPATGYTLRGGATAANGVSATGDAIGSSAFVARTAGAVTTHALIATPTAVTANVNGTAASVSIRSTNQATSSPLRVGRSSGAVYADMEFYGAAIFRRALSPTEITTLSNYFTGRIA